MMRTAALALLVSAASGCATPRAALAELPEADITTAEQVLALNGSAASIGLLYVSFAISVDELGDGQCPTRLDLGSTTLWGGGCTDTSGDEWTGRLVVRHGPGRLRVSYRDFGTVGSSPELLSGRIEVREQQNATWFTLELHYADRDEQITILYEGRTTARLLEQARDQDEPSVWNGAGSFARSGYGKIEVETVDERMDDSSCAREPASGTTQLSAGGHTVVITYDGAHDCDPEGTATWTLDGVAMGELTGIRCSTNTNTRGWPWLFVIIPVLAARRRRARRAPAP